MKNDPKVSVVIPTFNDSAILLENLNKMKLQTFDSFEVLVIDDGSDDFHSNNLKNGIKNLIDLNIRYLYKSNGGVSSARNFGIQMSSGLYITFLDSDDYFEPQFIEKMYETITNLDYAYDFCYTGYKILNQNGVRNIPTVFSNKDVLVRYIEEKIRFHTDSVLIKKDFLQKHSIKFNEDHNWMEDSVFFIEILANTDKITYVNDYLAVYNSLDNHAGRLSEVNLDKIQKSIDIINYLLSNPRVSQHAIAKQAILHYKKPLVLSNMFINLFKSDGNYSNVEMIYSNTKKQLKLSTYNIYRKKYLKVQIRIIQMKIMHVFYMFRKVAIN